jgi:hypothetical protein
MMRSVVSWRGVIAVLLTSACSHSEPFAPATRDPRGPAGTGWPLRLTFNPGDDRAPNVLGDLVAYSRFDPGDPVSGQCLALLPVEGGTLAGTFCPPAPTPADTFIHGWLEPALSPDGRQLAYVWRRSGGVSLTAWAYDLVVAGVDSPAVPLFSRRLGGPLSGDRFWNSATELAWIAPGRLRLLAAMVAVGRLADPFPGRLTDTTTIPRALMELDLSTGVLDIVPGGDLVTAWARDSADTYIVAASPPGTVFRLRTDGSRDSLGDFPDSVTDLAVAGPWLVAAVGRDRLYRLALSGGPASPIAMPDVAYRLSPAGDDRVVLEVERTRDVYGGPANLWLVPISRVNSLESAENSRAGMRLLRRHLY